MLQRAHPLQELWGRLSRCSLARAQAHDGPAFSCGLLGPSRRPHPTPALFLPVPVAGPQLCLAAHLCVFLAVPGMRAWRASSPKGLGCFPAPSAPLWGGGPGTPSVPRKVLAARWPACSLMASTHLQLPGLPPPAHPCSFLPPQLPSPGYATAVRQTFPAPLLSLRGIFGHWNHFPVPAYQGNPFTPSKNWLYISALLCGGDTWKVSKSGWGAAGGRHGWSPGVAGRTWVWRPQPCFEPGSGDGVPWFVPLASPTCPSGL